MKKLLLALPLLASCYSAHNFPSGRITRINAEDPFHRAYFYIDRRAEIGKDCDIEFTDLGQNGVMDYYSVTCGKSVENGEVHEAPENIKKIAITIATDYALQGAGRKP